MTHSNHDIDEKIRRALAADDAAFAKGDPGALDDFDSLREQGIFQMLLEVFRGRQRWLNLFGGVLQLVYLLLTVWTAWRFFQAEEVRDQILFSAGFLACLGITMAFKIWFWMVLNRNAVLREVKRLELQVARLSHE